MRMPRESFVDEFMAFSIGDPSASSIYSSLDQNGGEKLQLALGPHVYEIPVADNPYEYQVYRVYS